MRFTHPRRSLKSMQPRENQSALLSYAVPFCRTSGAMYPWVPLGRRKGTRSYQSTPTLQNSNSSAKRLRCHLLNNSNCKQRGGDNGDSTQHDSWNKTTFPVLIPISIGMNINKLQYEINMKTCKLWSRRGNLNHVSLPALQL